MENIIQISKDITLQEAMAIFFNEKALKLPEEKIYRMDIGNYRYYYKFEDGKPVFYQSMTTLIHNTLPTSKFLIDWYAQNGLDKVAQILLETSTYGTFLHKESADFLINRTTDLDTMDKRLYDFLIEQQMPTTYVKEWIHEIRKDLLAFVQFVIDVNFEPIAIEMVMVSDDGYGGALDLVGYMTVEEKGFFGETYVSGAKAGQPKETKQEIRVLAIVDMKSGKKGFWESHEIQLHGYKRMWDENYPDLKIERVYNWSPKAWRTKPTYNLKDQTGSVNAAKLPHMLEIAKIEDSKRDRKVTITSGILDLERIRKNPDIMSGNVREVSLEEVVALGEKKRQQAQEPKKEFKIEDDMSIDDVVKGVAKSMGGDAEILPND